MPNRIVRDGWLDSELIRGAGHDAEPLFLRLILVADDFGRFDGRVSVICRRCWPVAGPTDEQVTGWLARLVEHNLIVRYEVDGKPIIEIRNFRQRTRAQVSKYPAMPDGRPTGDRQVTVNRPAPAHGDGDGDGVKALSGKGSPEHPGGTPGEPNRQPDPPGHRKKRQRARQASDEETGHARDVLAYLNERARCRFQPTATNLGFILERMDEGYSPYVLKLLVYDRARRWLNDPKMSDYLRPATLFNGEKCNQYAGQIAAQYWRTCQGCGAELLPGVERCATCPPPASTAVAARPVVPMPAHLRRREGEGVRAWMSRIATNGEPRAPAP